MDTWRYPANWPAISKRIRERDACRCRWCGAGEGLFDLATGKAVRLTAMHLDSDTFNCADWNLVTACRSCHAAYDARHAASARAMTRHWQTIAAGQLELFP